MTPQKCANTRYGRREKNFDPLRGFGRGWGRRPGRVGGAWRRLAAGVGAGALVLTGCGAGVAIAAAEEARSEGVRTTDLYLPGSGGAYAEMVEHHITLTDGRTVTCLVAVSTLGQAPDCDFRGASR